MSQTVETMQEVVSRYREARSTILASLMDVLKDLTQDEDLRWELYIQAIDLGLITGEDWGGSPLDDVGGGVDSPYDELGMERSGSMSYPDMYDRLLENYEEEYGPGLAEMPEPARHWFQTFRERAMASGSASYCYDW